MGGPVNGVVILVVNSLDDVSLFSDTRIWKNCVGCREILQIRLERTNEDRRSVRNIFSETDRSRNLLHIIDSRNFTHPHTHRIA